jgi:hypothetical protein
MALQSGSTFHSAQIPELGLIVAAGRDEQLFTWVELQIPNTLFVASKRCLQLEGLGVPEFDLLVLTRSCNHFVIGRNPYAIDVLLVSHDSQLSRRNRHQRAILVSLRDSPHLECVVLAN